MTEPQLWERQPGETNSSWEGFKLYRDLPPTLRSFDRVYFTQRKGLEEGPQGARAAGSFRTMATRNRWATRAEAWDREKDRLAREAELAAERQAIIDMRKRHIGLGISLQTMAANELKKRLDPAKGKTEEITTFGVIRALVEGTKIERVARGEPETIIQTTSGPDEPAASNEHLIQRIIENPAAARAARDLVLALQPGAVEGDAGVSGEPAEQG